MRAILAAAALIIACVPGAFAQDVTLSSQDGAITLEGSLIAFDGEFYRVDSAYGPLTVSADGVSCDGPGCPDLAAFVAEARFYGAAIIADGLLPALIEAFARDRGFALTRSIAVDSSSVFELLRDDGSPAARFHVLPGTTEDGFLALLNDETDLALALREPLAVEELAAAASEPGAALSRRARVIALDALVPVTSRAHPLHQIRADDLARLFTGRITSWSELGGQDVPVSLHLPAAESGLAQAFTAEILAETGHDLAPAIVRHADPRDLSDAVARDPFAIGITSLSAIGNARALALEGDCGFVLEATPETLKSEDYPLTAPLFVYPSARRMPRLVREFLAFFESNVAEREVRLAGFVSQAITRAPLEEQGRRLANAILAAGAEISLDDLQRLARRMSEASRLSPTFRFSGGATEFDAQSLSAISRLARAIEQGEFDGRALVFVGFSDGEGSAGTNLSLARRRAETVRRAVIEAAVTADLNRVQLRTAAFGEALPIACDDTDWGAAANRRVEVWLE